MTLDECLKEAAERLRSRAEARIAGGNHFGAMRLLKVANEISVLVEELKAEAVRESSHVS